MTERFALFATILLTGCATLSPVSESAPTDRSETARQGAIALLPVLDREAGPKANLFYSPASIEQAFGMLGLGAAGETKAQIEAILPPPRDPKGLATKKDGVEVRLANALWLSDKYRFRQSFVESAERSYGATAEAIDIARPKQAADRVNAWASKATDGLISQVLTAKSVTPLTVAFLTNALYFDGLWAKPFDGREEKPFLFGDGSQRSFTLMREVLVVPLAEREGWQAVRLPYRNARYAMDVLLPERRTVMKAAPPPSRITEFAADLAAAKPRPVDVSLPRFEIEYRRKLIPDLQAIGLTLPFDSAQADLSAVAEPGQARLAVDDVEHIAKLQVFDTGTRAPAVTSMRIVVVGATRYDPEPVPCTVDRPFIVVIRDLERGEILFLGRIANPQPFEPEVVED